MKKIIVSLCSLLFMFCVITANNTVFADNEQYTEVTVTASTSRTFWIEDPEDSRYMIGRQYISFNTSPRSAGIIKIRFTTQNINYNNNYSSPTLYSPNGVDCRYIGDIYGASTDVWTYGNEFLIQWIDLQEFMLIYEYKVLKTVYNSTSLAEITYNGLITTGSYSNLNLRIIPSLEGMTPAEIELINQNIELLVLNENLSDQAIEDYLQQINQNYLPTIIDMLQTIHGAIEADGNGQYESFIYVKNSARVNATVNDTRYYPTYERTNYYGDGFSIENGKIKCNYDGYVIIASNAYFYRYSSNTTVADIYFRWIKNGTSIGGYNDSIRGGYGGTTCATTDIISVEQGDLLNFSFSTSSQPISYMETSTALIYYLSKDSTLDYSGQLSNIIQKEQLIYETLNEIKGMIPTAEQVEEIDLNYQEITNIDNSINTITNDYNTIYDNQTENLPLSDLLNESSNDVINSSNLYNSVFADILDIPYMKGITSLIILCVVIVVLLG